MPEQYVYNADGTKVSVIVPIEEWELIKRLAGQSNDMPVIPSDLDDNFDPDVYFGALNGTTIVEDMEKARKEWDVRIEALEAELSPKK